MLAQEMYLRAKGKHVLSSPMYQALYQALHMNYFIPSSQQPYKINDSVVFYKIKKTEDLKGEVTCPRCLSWKGVVLSWCLNVGQLGSSAHPFRKGESM